MNQEKLKIVAFDLMERNKEKGEAYLFAVLDVIGELLKTEQPADKKKPKKEIDTGKIRALKNAGWTQKAIAEEMNVSVPTVAKYLAEMEETDEAK